MGLHTPAFYKVEFNKYARVQVKTSLLVLERFNSRLSLSEESGWMRHFNDQKQIALELKSKINRIDNEIDQKVYELYGLTEEEIRIVEQN